VRSWKTIVAGTVLALMCVTPRADAQGMRRVDASPADQAIAAGRLAQAEDELFEQARRAPREPSVRGALGNFLAGRGKLLVGAVLLEEALDFGGDSATIESRLFEIYRWTGRYARAASQRHARIAPELLASMGRAAALQFAGADSATVPMLPNEAFGMGRISVSVAGERVELDIQPLAMGIVLPSTMAMYSSVEHVSARGDTTFAVARNLMIGDVRIGPVPVMLVPKIRVGRIGLDVLGRLRPTFDAGAKTLTIRATPAEDAPVGRAYPFLLTFPGVSFFPRAQEGPVTLHTVAGRSALRGLRWTLDVDGGMIVIER
jgi:hypothetical protein